MGAALRSAGADVLRRADAGTVAAAQIVPASAGTAFSPALAWLPDMQTREVRGRRLRQAKAGSQSTEGAGGEQSQRDASGSSSMKGSSEAVKTISVHMMLQCDEVRTEMCS
jgi:hypothetical protein